MENSMSMPHILTWENREQVKAPRLLIKLWKETEKDLNIDRGELGIVTNVRDPLETFSSDNDAVESQGESKLSTMKTKAIVEVSENLRAKIYSFFLKVPQEDLEGMQPSDYVWLSLIDKYLDLKSAEVWTEITSELTNAAIRPTSPDQEVLESINRMSLDKASSLVAQQNELQESILAQEQTDEQIFYGQMRSTMRQQEKLVDDFNAYVKRTSKYQTLKSAKRDQVQSIDQSRGSGVNYRKDKNFHITAIEGNLSTTVFAGKFVNADHVAKHDVIKMAAPRMTATSSKREARFSAD